MVKKESDNTTETTEPVVKEDAEDVLNGKTLPREERNPVMILNELRSDLKYNLIEQSGPSHSPTFKISLEVDGKVYVGTGNSKKTAKYDAAYKALKDNPSGANNSTERNPVLVLNEVRMNLNYDIIEHSGPVHNPTFKIAVEVDGKVYTGTGNTKKAAKYEAATQVLKDNPDLLKEVKKKAVKTVNIQEKNPVMVLNELYSNLKFNLVEYSGPVHQPTFKISVEINGKEFLGVSNSKKSAKLEAAIQALKSLTINNTKTISV